MSKVLIPLADGCEELEAVTLIDLLRRAEIGVMTASLMEKTVKCSRGTFIVADTELDLVVASEYDMLALPGGLPGANHLMNDQRVQKILKDFSNNNKYTAAICAAPRALAAAGLLDNCKVTSFPGALDDLNIPGMNYCEQAIVHDKNIITSRGPGTAMDFALYLIELLSGKQKRIEVESALQRP